MKSTYAVSRNPDPWPFYAEGREQSGTWAYTVYDENGDATCAGPARSKEEAHRWGKAAANGEQTPGVERV